MYQGLMSYHVCIVSGFGQSIDPPDLLIESVLISNYANYIIDVYV